MTKLNGARDDRAWAIRIVRNGLDTLKELEREQQAWRLGDLWSFAQEEHDQLRAS